jgi:hypothetical protein
LRIRLLRVIPQALRDELPVLVEVLHPLGEDLTADAIDVDLRSCPGPAATERPIDRR